jgi:mono/diheme cytochrome c family protein
MNTTKIVRLAAVTAAVLAAVGVQAQENKMGVSQPEVNYQAGGSPLADTPMYQSTNPKAPAMTQAEFDLGRKTYFERCAGCHGVLRKGATGKPLTPDITLAKGTDYLKVFIAYGSPAGMPNWLTSGEMDEKTVDVMARYVQQDPPVPPEWGMAQMKEHVEGHRAAGPAAEEEDEQLQHRQHLLDHAARRRRGGADRRRHQADHQHRQDRLCGAHLAYCPPRAATCS